MRKIGNKLNNKGLTILELLIATGLISVVILFLYNMLTDVNDEFTNNDFAVNSQLNKFEITKTIQSNINQNKTFGAELRTNPDSTYIFTMVSADVLEDNSIKNMEVSEITISKDEILINRDITGDSEKFLYEFEDLEIGTPTLCGERMVNDNSKAIVKLHIPVYTLSENNNASNNNLVDDITIDYYGDYMDYIPINPC